MKEIVFLEIYIKILLIINNIISLHKISNKLTVKISIH